MYVYMYLVGISLVNFFKHLVNMNSKSKSSTDDTILHGSIVHI